MTGSLVITLLLQEVSTWPALKQKRIYSLICVLCVVTGHQVRIMGLAEKNLVYKSYHLQVVTMELLVARAARDSSSGPSVLWLDISAGVIWTVR